MYRVNFQKATQSKNKYNAKSKEYGGKRYDSIKEARYAEELDWLVKAKKIQGWERQVKIDLKVNGKHICNYYCDFKVIHNDGSIEFAEVKGMVLPLWEYKWRLFDALLEEMYPGARMTVVK
mgnify:CR=1 FL=1